MTIRSSLIAIAIVYALNLVLDHFGVYGLLPPIDIPIHLLGGFTVGLLGAALFHRALPNTKTPWWLVALFVIGFGTLVGVCWEFKEWVIDHTLHTWHHQPFSQLSNDDTMKDLLDDVLGASLAMGITLAKRRKK